MKNVLLFMPQRSRLTALLNNINKRKGFSLVGKRHSNRCHFCELHFLFFMFIMYQTGVAAAQNSVVPKGYSQAHTFKSSPQSQQQAKTTITFAIINNQDKTFGYDIYTNGRLLIHQPNIPGLPGNKGFGTASDATKVAKLVIAKIKKGAIPPSVCVEELKRLRTAN